MSSEKDVENVYVRLLPSELADVSLDENGTYPEFKLKSGDVVLRLRKVRVAGRVEEVEDRGRMVEITVSDGKGAARIRGWDEEGKKLLSLKPGDIVEVLGALRVFRGELYIALKLFRKIDEVRLTEYLNLLRRDREILLSKKGEQTVS